jgi:drug/metabolite transporter (DMT)-like permease
VATHERSSDAIRPGVLSSFMRSNSSAIVQISAVLPHVTRSGLAWGFLGVAAFSFTVPFTRVAVGGLSPLFIGSGRAVVAAVLAITALTLTREALPRGLQWGRIALVGGGIVVGFPLLTSFALVSAPASHGAVVIAVLPAATAAAAVLRTGEHPPRSFWTAAGFGTLAAVGFTVTRSGGLGELHWADLLLFGAVLAAAIGYAEGGMLARELGAWQTVCWALVVCAPLMGVLTLVALSREAPHGSPTEWLAFAYLGLVSMFLGFFAWYRGLAIGPMAQISQVQLVQPVMSITWAGLLLGEHITAATLLGGLVVIACAGTAVRARVH